MDIDRDTKDMQHVRAALLNLVDDMVGAGINTMAIAAMMSNIALQMYKTALSNKEYNAMVDYISANRGRIKSLLATNEELH